MSLLHQHEIAAHKLFGPAARLKSRGEPIGTVWRSRSGWGGGGCKPSWPTAADRRRPQLPPLPHLVVQQATVAALAHVVF